MSHLYDTLFDHNTYLHTNDIDGLTLEINQLHGNTYSSAISNDFDLNTYSKLVSRDTNNKYLTYKFQIPLITLTAL